MGCLRVMMRLKLSFPFSSTGIAAAIQCGGWVGKETRPETANVRLRTDGDQRGGWVRRLAVLAILGAAWAVVTPRVVHAEYDNPRWNVPATQSCSWNIRKWVLMTAS